MAVMNTTIEKMLEIKNRTDGIEIDISQIDPTLDDVKELLGDTPSKKDVPFMLWLSEALSSGENEGYYDDIVAFLQEAIQNTIPTEEQTE